MKFKHLGTNNFEDYSYRDGLDLCRLLDIHEEDAWLSDWIEERINKKYGEQKV